MHRPPPAAFRDEYAATAKRTTGVYMVTVEVADSTWVDRDSRL